VSSVISVQRCELCVGFVSLATCLLALRLSLVWARNDERGERREGGAGN